jgi:hypothetical protein
MNGVREHETRTFLVEIDFKVHTGFETGLPPGFAK